MNENENQNINGQAAPQQAEQQTIPQAQQAPAAPAQTAAPEKKVAPKIFFNKDEKIEISVNGYHSNKTGELAFVLLADDTADAVDDDSYTDMFTKVNYKFWFTRCSYDKLNRWRSRSMIYNTEDQNNTINELKLREFFLIFNLVDWNLTDENGSKVELKFDPNKALSNESLKLIYTSLPASLLDTVLTAYEKKISL